MMNMGSCHEDNIFEGSVEYAFAASQRREVGARGEDRAVHTLGFSV